MGAETAGTETLFLKYDHDWYLSRANAKADTNAVVAIAEIPTLPGYTFDGYYTGMGGAGDCIIKPDGSLNMDADGIATQGDAGADLRYTMDECIRFLTAEWHGKALPSV